MTPGEELQEALTKGFVVAEDGGIWAAQFPDRYGQQNNYQLACKNMGLIWQEHAVFITHLPNPPQEGMVRTVVLVSLEFMRRLQAREGERKIVPHAGLGTWGRIQDAGLGWLSV